MYGSTLILMVGLPRSGKSTVAREISLRTGAPIVSPDAIRIRLTGQPFYGPAEPVVWGIAKTMVNALFEVGYPTVILDATNTTRARRDKWKNEEWRVVCCLVDEVSEVCMDRAAGNPVLITVINRMAEKWEGLEADEDVFMLEDLQSSHGLDVIQGMTDEQREMFIHRQNSGI